MKFEIAKDKNLMEIPVRVVQPNIPQIEKWNRLLFQENLEKLIGLTLINNKPDEKKIVIWPEVAVTSYFNEEEELAQYLRQKIPPNIILITGSLRREFTKNSYNIFNSFYILKKNGQIVYDKKN